MKKQLMRFVFLLLVISSRLAATTIQFSPELLAHPEQNSKVLEMKFRTEEIPRYRPDTIFDAAILENGYAQSKIINPEEWVGSEGICVKEIRLVYTKYPKDKSFWLTDYHRLLADRLLELFKLDPKLNSSTIKWIVVLQTDCKNAREAQKRFHGIEIRYDECEPSPPPLLTDTMALLREKMRIDSLRYVRLNKKVERYITRNGGVTDSVVLKVLNRHPEWDKALVVMDWTGSMYPYGGQVALWHSKNLGKTGIEYCVFFNDGDKKPSNAKVAGKVGGVYFAKTENFESVIRLMQKVQSKGNGGDGQENDVEALLKGIDHFTGYNQVILIADNNACMRDSALMTNIHVPVHVILCGTQSGINPQYVELAKRTGGTIHTIEQDLSGDDLTMSNDDLQQEMRRFVKHHYGYGKGIFHISGKHDPCGGIPASHRPKKLPFKKRVKKWWKKHFN